jgi:hypothetical protein
MDYYKIRRTVLLSIQRALLGMIYSEIRAIAVGFEETKKLKVIYYLDREPNDYDYENLSDVTSEVLGDVNFSEVEEICCFSKDLIKNLDCLDSWVYVRKE